MKWAKLFIQLLLPYLVDAVRKVIARITLKKKRQQRGETSEEKSKAYSKAKTEEGIESTYENLP